MLVADGQRNIMQWCIVVLMGFANSSIGAVVSPDHVWAIAKVRVGSDRQVVLMMKALGDEWWDEVPCVHFDVVHWIHSVKVPDAQKARPIMVPVPGMDRLVGGVPMADVIGQWHLIMGGWNGREVIVDDFWRLQGDDAKSIVLRETAGMNEIERVRRLRDESARLKLYEQTIRQTKSPSIILVLHARQLQSTATSDMVRARVRLALLPLVLRDDVPVEVRELAGEQLVRWPMSNDEASVAAACETTLKPLMESFQKLAQTPGKEPDRERVILGAMTAVLQYAKPPVGADLSLKEFGQELAKYRETLTKQVPTGPEVIDLSKIPKPGEPVKIEPVKPKELVWRTAEVEKRIAALTASP